MISRYCEWRDYGVECREPGSFSHCTRGGGPWLCWDHFTGGKHVHNPSPDEKQRVSKRIGEIFSAIGAKRTSKAATPLPEGGVAGSQSPDPDVGEWK